MIRSLFHPASVNPRCLPPQRVMVSLLMYQSRNPAALNQVSSCSRWRGTMVVQTASGALHIKDPEDGPKTVQDTCNAGGLAALVLRRQPDGSWRLVIDNACPFGETLA
jgi:hypothetical protein